MLIRSTMPLDADSCPFTALPQGKIPSSRLALDYVQGFFCAVPGLYFFGPQWLFVLGIYLIHPMIGRLFRGRVIQCGPLRIRLGECDLSVLVNLMRDYDVRFLRAALKDCDLLIDAGANIGAFTCLAKALKPSIAVIALEPDLENIAFLRTQPFADDIECRRAALGPRNGFGRFLEGENSVTHSIDFNAGGDTEVLSLASLVSSRTLLKLDIEGGEKAVLSAGLPNEVEWLVMEWHFQGSPVSLLPTGQLQQRLKTVYGQTTWSWARLPASTKTA